ncbi:MAG: hypothetical protein ABI183_02170, partial [Polyangiaceae bacterium]
AACISLGAVACGHPKTPAELESGLESADPSVRRTSADDLRDGGRVPSGALPKLYAAIDKEHDPEAYGAMVITLGASGDAGARSYVCGKLGGEGIDDPRVSRWRGTAQTAWLRKNPDQGGCSMSMIQEVPRSQGPQATKPKPVAPKATMWSHGM